ncbi:MAG: DUF975 family protein [Ruminococcaceae bacterium]|nr:DUF975 family protein [Oscillospiraceae bacterium]
MSAEKIIKSQARKKLSDGGFAKALIVLGIIAVCYMMVECISSVFYYINEAFKHSDAFEFILQVTSGSITTICLLLLSPIVIGYFKMLYNEQKEYDINDAVYYLLNFKRYIKAVMFVFSLVVRLLLPTAICYIPVISLYAINAFMLKNSMNETLFTITVIVLIIFSTTAFLLYSTRYFLSIKLFCEDENQQMSYYFLTSKIIMNGHANALIKLVGSFVPWLLLCVTVLPLLYVLPYMTQAICISGNWLLQLSRNGLEK